MPAKVDESHDVVVIGAGHNGLVAANYLANAGLDVLVVDGDSQVGGMTSSGYLIPAAPEHVINHCAVDPIFWNAFPPAHELQLERYGLRSVEADPPYAYLDPEGASLAVWRDPRKTADEIRHFSASDAEAYLDFARLLDALYDIAHPLSLTNPTRPDARAVARVVRGSIRNRRKLGDLPSFGVASSEEVILERFEHPIVRSALLCVPAAVMPNSHFGSAIQFMSLAFLHRAPCRRPVGGTGAIPNALTARLLDHGGTVRTSAVVVGITVSGSRASGIELADGTRIGARRAVLAACQPVHALHDLLPSGTLPPEMDRRVSTIPTRQMGYGMLKVDVALSGRLDLSRHNKQRRDGLDLREPSHWIGTPDGLERSFARSAAGLVPYESDWASWNCIPTALDPSQGPAGQDSLYVWVCAAPAEPEGGWEGGLKEKAGQSILNKMSEFYGGLTELEIGRQVQSNEDVAEKRRCPGGHLTHVDFGLNRIGPLRPARGLGGYRTPVPGLYLGASGSHPGGGVTGVPGYNSAREILRTLRAEQKGTAGRSLLRRR